MSKEINIENIDRNFKIETNIDEPDLRFYDVKEEPFELYGFYKPFTRLPDEVANDETVNDNVRSLYKMSAGGRVRFSTDSPYIAIKAVMPKVSRSTKGTVLGNCGFDLYIDSDDGSQSLFCRSFIPPMNVNTTNGYESKVTFKSRVMRNYTINFPLYNEVSELYIGLSDSAAVKGGAKYRDLLPIVYYGTSITQGACASRPGNTYLSMVSRELNMDYVNIGFSDGGRGEKALAEYFAKLPMSCFVNDYSTNVGPAGLRKTFLDFYKIFREAQPDVPYVMIGRPDTYRETPDFPNIKDMAENRAIMVETYNYAVSNGDDKVYYIDGESLWTGPFADSCTVDGVHPNDLGFSHMATAVLATLKRIIRDGKLYRENK